MFSVTGIPIINFKFIVVKVNETLLYTGLNYTCNIPFYLKHALVIPSVISLVPRDRCRHYFGLGFYHILSYRLVHVYLSL